MENDAWLFCKEKIKTGWWARTINARRKSKCRRRLAGFLYKILQCIEWTNNGDEVGLDD